MQAHGVGGTPYLAWALLPCDGSVWACWPLDLCQVAEENLCSTENVCWLLMLVPRVSFWFLLNELFCHINPNVSSQPDSDSWCVRGRGGF